MYNNAIEPWNMLNIFEFLFLFSSVTVVAAVTTDATVYLSDNENEG